MKVIDISVTIRPDMPVWPSDAPVQLYRKAEIEQGANANVSFLAMSAHTGTHVDAPYHFLQDGTTVDKIDLDILIGETEVVQIPPGFQEISAKTLSEIKYNPKCTRVLFKTSNSSLWHSPDHTFHSDFLGVTADASEILMEKNVKLVGIDYLSIAPYKRSRPTHEIMLKANMVIIEGLDLFFVDPGIYTLYCLPLKLLGADGAPARAILIQE
jgi:arylformamidase